MKKRGIMLVLSLFLVSLMVGGVSGADTPDMCTVELPFACNDVSATSDGESVTLSLSIPNGITVTDFDMTVQLEWVIVECVVSKEEIIALNKPVTSGGSRQVTCRSVAKLGNKGDNVPGNFTIKAVGLNRTGEIPSYTSVGSYSVTVGGREGGATANRCPDVNNDGIVDQEDLNSISSVFGTAAHAIREHDLNNDGVINAKDLVIAAKSNGKGVSEIQECSSITRVFLSSGEYVTYAKDYLAEMDGLIVSCSAEESTIQEEIGPCTDSDSGENYGVKGETSSIKLSYSSGVQSWTDTCLRDFDLYKEGSYSPAAITTDEGGIMEGVCSSSGTTGTVHTRECTNGCQDGACIGGAVNELAEEEGTFRIPLEKVSNNKYEGAFYTTYGDGAIVEVDLDKGTLCLAENQALCDGPESDDVGFLDLKAVSGASLVYTASHSKIPEFSFYMDLRLAGSEYLEIRGPASEMDDWTLESPTKVRRVSLNRVILSEDGTGSSGGSSVAAPAQQGFLQKLGRALGFFILGE